MAIGRSDWLRIIDGTKDIENPRIAVRQLSSDLVHGNRLKGVIVAKSISSNLRHAMSLLDLKPSRPETADLSLGAFTKLTLSRRKPTTADTVNAHSTLYLG